MRQLIILLIFTVLSCKNDTNNSSSASSSNSCKQLEQQVKQLKSNLSSHYKGYIGHDIYLKLKDSKDESAVIKVLNSLGNVKGVEALKVGPFKNLGDKRALNYDIKMQMYFKDEKAYKYYNSDSTHLNVRKQLGPLLSAPPASFDFIVE